MDQTPHSPSAAPPPSPPSSSSPRSVELALREREAAYWGAWMWPLIIGIVGFFIVHPFDGALSDVAARASKGLGGDIRRELQAWQQYGQGLALAVTALIIFLLDPKRRVRLLDLLLAVIIAQVAAQAGKMLIGRPRPREWYDDSNTFLGPLGEYPMRVKGEWKLLHAWDVPGGAGSDLWSMPSSHTLFAAVLSVFLATVYPPIRWVALGLAVLVGLGRVLFDAHWPTDVIVGGAVGWAIGAWVVGPGRGVRLFGRFKRAESAAEAG